jgi:hypothetical protein
VICFTKVRFLQTYSPLRWSQRPGLFQPFPSLKRSPRPSELLFLIKWDTKGPFGKAPAPASLAPDPDPSEELILLILLENQNHFSNRLASKLIIVC